MIKTIALNLQEYLTLRLTLVVYFLGYIIPFIIAQPQFITGTVVNALIFVSAEKLEKKYIYPILILPSLGAITHGVLFGPQTYFLLYFLPFIWLGNYLQVSVFSLIKKQSYPVRVGAAALAKYLLLFVMAGIYYQAHIVPKIFITSMGLIQLVTACLGGLLAYFILQLLKTNE